MIRVAVLLACLGKVFTDGAVGDVFEGQSMSQESCTAGAHNLLLDEYRILDPYITATSDEPSTDPLGLRTTEGWTVDVPEEGGQKPSLSIKLTNNPELGVLLHDIHIRVDAIVTFEYKVPGYDMFLLLDSGDWQRDRFVLDHEVEATELLITFVDPINVGDSSYHVSLEINGCDKELEVKIPEEGDILAADDVAGPNDEVLEEITWD